MADKNKTKSSRKPVSLNDSHYRFLQQHSTPRPPFPSDEEKPSMAKLWDDVDDSIPQFSGITDFDSPLKLNEEKQNLSELEAKSVVAVKPQYDDEDDDCMPKFSLGSPFEINEEQQNPLDASESFGNLKEKVKDDDNTTNFSGNIGSVSPPKQKEEQNPVKIKIQGRRRLCKVSTQNDENAHNSATLDEPSDYDIPDFESPRQPPRSNIGIHNGTDGCGNEIRDILNDLSSRLGLLSIEKKRVPRKVDPAEESVALEKVHEVSEVEKADLPEYASAGSSFSHSSGRSDASSDASKKAGGDVEDNLVDEYKESEFGGDSIGSMMHEPREDSTRPTKVEPRKANGRLVTVGRSFISSSDDEEEKSKSKAANYENRAHGTLNNKLTMKKSEPRRLGQSSKSNFEEDDDDCVIVSNRKEVKKVDRKGGKLNTKGDGSVAVDMLDGDNDATIPEFEGSITLRGPRSTYTLPGRIAKMLYPHQRDGLRWLWSLHCKGKGGILGDDMGLGKTMQICGFLAGLFHSHLIKRALVVAPKTLLSHWVKELSVVGLSEKTREYYSTCPRTRQYELQYVLQDKGILLTTYDIVRNNVKSLRGDHYLDDDGSEDSVIWDYMILDEGHLIKNPSTQRAKSLLEIPSPHRIIISGTPLQNNLKELWALFNFSCPELLGDKKWFKEKYEHFILRGSEKKASDRDKRVGSAVAKELRERIEPYFLRRLKSEVFNDNNAQQTAKLSKKNEIIVWLRLTNCQRQLYEAFLKSELVLSAFDGSPLAALTILKKICDHPLLLTKRAAEDVLEGMDSMLKPEDACMAEKLAKHIADVAEGENFEEKHDNVSCKISFIMSLLDNLIPKGHNVLIFSQTRKMLNIIQESLASNGYKYLRIDGTTKASDRVKIVDEFQEGNSAPIFLLTSQVGGLGLTLTNADRVIVVDPAWNPSTDNQSVDRAYRIGQKKDVLVYRLMTCGTVEEKIYRKQIFKGGLFKTATEHKEQIRYFSQQDLRELFSIPTQGFDVSLTQQQLHEEHDSQHKMDESLQANVKFLETLGIAGVSHHSLLFSKTAPVTDVQEEEKEEIRRRATTMTYNSSSSSSVERVVDGAEYAFKPTDVKLNKKSSTPDSVGAGKLTESEIKDRIKRLNQIFENKAMVSRLADKGEKIQKQIAELNSELDKITVAKKTGKEVIDLDDITGDLQRVLHV